MRERQTDRQTSLVKNIQYAYNRAQFCVKRKSERETETDRVEKESQRDRETDKHQ